MCASIPIDTNQKTKGNPRTWFFCSNINLCHFLLILMTLIRAEDDND